ncbi:type VII secretion target [Nocardia sp. NPDC050712]|uniref:type VII secretion target n=1 Tax=Nocardia sp. NPDC050712 TaxID=3155518 RepID=UPI0033EC9017
MGNEALSVDPDEVRAHAENLKSVIQDLDTALEAATYLGNADDGYGKIPRPVVSWLLDDNFEATVAAIRTVAENVAALPDKLETVATTFEDKDGSFGKALSELRETIGESGGTK